MPISTQEIIEIVKTIATDQRLKVTVTECAKCGVIAGVSAAAGGLLLGPAGVAIVGCIGACVGALTAKKFLPLWQIIATMEEEKKEALARNVRQIANNLEVADGVAFAGLLAGNATVRQQVTTELINFFSREMQMSVA